MKDTYYFSHDYNSRNDHKIKKLVSKHGYLGYGLFWAIIEDLYQNDNSIELDYDTLCYDYRSELKLIQSIISDFDLFVIENNCFGSISIQNRLDKRNEKSKTARDNANKRWGENNSRLKAEKCIFYILDFFNENENFLKCGLTTESISRRYSGKTANYKYEVLKQIECSLDKAIELEKLIADNCTKYEPKNKFGGYLECYNPENLSKIIELLMQGECQSIAENKNSNAIKERKVNEIKEKENKNISFNFESALISYGFNTELVSDWLQVRKAKKATNTETSFNNFVSQVEKSGVDKNEILKICISRDWKGFNTDWIKDMDIPKEKKPFISNNPYFALCDSQPTLSDKLKKQQYEF
jgi:hypothetical protein